MAYRFKNITGSPYPLPSLGKTVPANYDAPISDVLDLVNPENLIVYPDIQNGINANILQIIDDVDSTKEITHVSQVNRLLHHNEVLTKQIFTQIVGAPGLLVNSSFPLSWGGIVDISTMGLVYGRQWQINHIEVLLGTAPSTGNLVLQGQIDGVSTGNFSITNGSNSGSVSPPSLIVEAGEVFNIQVVTASLAQNLLCTLECNFFV